MLRPALASVLLFAVSCSGAGSESRSSNAVRPRTAERASERAYLVDALAEHGIRDGRVLQALRDVPRHWFVPESGQRDAYLDEALPIGAGQTISQPYIVALMTEALALAPDARVLEIGTGSGYQAAVLSEITPHVFTIEIVEALAKRSRAIFEERGYGSIRCRTGDGWAGWPEEAPFDAVIVTAAPDHPPQALLDQLRAGGRMCIPVGTSPADQHLQLITKQSDGTTTTRAIAAVRFVPMTGRETPPR